MSEKDLTPTEMADKYGGRMDTIGKLITRLLDSLDIPARGYLLVAAHVEGDGKHMIATNLGHEEATRLLHMMSEKAEKATTKGNA
jgi:hypothetical protein